MNSAASKGSAAGQPNSALPGRTISNTPAKLAASDTQVPRGARSCISATAPTVTRIGDIETIAVASASGRYAMLEKKHTDDIPRHTPRATCSAGLRVRTSERPIRGRKIAAISSTWKT